VGTGGYFPGVNQSGREADLAPSCTTEVKNAWSATSTYPYITWRGVQLSKAHFFMALYLVKHRDNLSFPTRPVCFMTPEVFVNGKW